MDEAEAVDKKNGLESDPDRKSAEEILDLIADIGEKITTGAQSFLAQEYLWLSLFAVVFSLILGFTVDAHEMSEITITIHSKVTNKDYVYPQPRAAFPFTATAFLIGASTSIAAGYIGMTIAVYTNTRTTFSCCKGE